MLKAEVDIEYSKFINCQEEMNELRSFGLYSYTKGHLQARKTSQYSITYRKLIVLYLYISTAYKQFMHILYSTLKCKS